MVNVSIVSIMVGMRPSQSLPLNSLTLPPQPHSQPDLSIVLLLHHDLEIVHCISYWVVFVHFLFYNPFLRNVLSTTMPGAGF